MTVPYRCQTLAGIKNEVIVDIAVQKQPGVMDMNVLTLPFLAV